MDKFEVDDKVEVIKAYSIYKVGDVGTITSINKLSNTGIFYRINGDRWGAPANHFKKVGDLYENQWYLVYINNGEKSWECRFLVLDKVERLT